MLNIGPQELLLILVLALLVVGPKRLPELGRSLGRGLRELRKAQDEVRKTIQVNLDETSPTSPHRPARRLPAEEHADGESPADEEPRSSGEPASGADLAAAAAAPAVAEGSSGVSEVSRTLGRSLAELRRAREEIQRSFRVDLDGPAKPHPAPRPVQPVSPSPSDTSAIPTGEDGEAAGDDAVDRPS